MTKALTFLNMIAAKIMKKNEYDRSENYEKIQ